MATAASSPELFDIPALAASDYTARQPTPILDVSGRPLLAASFVPEVLIGRAMSALRNASAMPLEARAHAIAEGVELFRDAEISGLSPSQYRWLTSRVAGLPAVSVDYSIDKIVETGREVDRAIEAATPRGVSRYWSDPALSGGGAIWVRKGNSLTVHASGNAPAIHASWLPALALGFRIAVRPSRRDPLTPHRLISALRQAGFANDELMLLPTDHSSADALIRGADLSVVFGSADVVARYRANPRVLVNGPGLSKMLITNEVDWQANLTTIVQAVSAGGGTSCGNVTGLFVEGNAGAVAEALADCLAGLPSLPPEHKDAALPVVASERAQEIESYYMAKAAGAHIRLGADGIRHDLGDGSATLRPAVTELGSATDPRLNVEMPFPCVWVAPWSRADGLEVFDDTLSLAALTEDHELIQRLCANPSIANLNVGGAATALEAAHLPHDDYLASFLMRAKAVRLPT